MQARQKNQPNPANSSGLSQDNRADFLCRFKLEQCRARQPAEPIARLRHTDPVTGLQMCRNVNFYHAEESPVSFAETLRHLDCVENTRYDNTDNGQILGKRLSRFSEIVNNAIGPNSGFTPLVGMCRIQLPATFVICVVRGLFSRHTS